MYNINMRAFLDISFEWDPVKAEAARTGIPYQSLINLYLVQCAEEGKTLAFA